MQNRIIAPESTACDTSAAKVPRKKRGASPLGAIRHLLRHINDPQELAANPLTADIFHARAASGLTLREGLQSVRAEVSRCIDQIGQHVGDSVVRERNRRAALILRRCDLDGAPHPEVALELGLSRRQFYRDRSIALQLLAAEMEARLHVPSLPMHAVNDVTALAFESAEALLAIGKFDDAKENLERLASSAAHPGDRLRALCDIVEVACEEMRDDEALAVLEHARRLKPDSAVESARVALAESAYATLMCRHLEAAAHRESAMLVLRPLNGSLSNVEMLARTFLAEAAARRERGEPRIALDAIESAQALLDRRQPFYPMLKALALNEQGAALMHVPDGLADASRMHRRAAELARERRFMRVAFASLLNDCAVDYWQGKPKSALTTACGVLEAARNVVFSQEFARMALMVSTFALAAKETNIAMELVEQATSVATDAGALRSRALLAQARLHLRTASYPRALELASEAVERLDSSGTKTLIGTALLYAAEAHANMEHQREAVTSVNEAIRQLELAGSPFHLSKAHRLAAKLTGARSHAKRAQEIAAALRDQ
jgi:hypothetical protein